jgi:hypothetical protein
MYIYITRGKHGLACERTSPKPCNEKHSSHDPRNKKENSHELIYEATSSHPLFHEKISSRELIHTRRFLLIDLFKRRSEFTDQINCQWFRVLM